MAKKIEIGLDASGIIRDYRAAIAAMEQAGAKSSITSGLTKSLDRLAPVSSWRCYVALRHHLMPRRVSVLSR